MTSPFVHLTGGAPRLNTQKPAPADKSKPAKPKAAAIGRFNHLKGVAPTTAEPGGAQMAPGTAAGLAVSILAAGAKARSPMTGKAPDKATEAGKLAAQVLAAAKRGVR